MFVSGEAWRLFKRAHPEQDFSDFWLEASLKFSIGCFDLSSFFLLRKKIRSASSTPPPSKVPKMEPLSPLADAFMMKINTNTHAENKLTHMVKFK
jgi:hypothetical protein